ncbi:peroxiredoxin family protein [Candidatus Omnitrophota bacterium]
MKKIILILALGLLLCSKSYALDFFQSNSKNMVVSDFTLQDLSGNSVSLSDFKDKGVILFFWTTWCPHCLRELTNFNEEYEDLKSSGIELLAIDIGESKRRVESFVNRHSIGFPILLDPNSSVAREYNVVGVPTIILISKQGDIVSVSHALPSDYKKLILE